MNVLLRYVEICNIVLSAISVANHYHDEGLIPIEISVETPSAIDVYWLQLLCIYFVFMFSELN